MTAEEDVIACLREIRLISALQAIAEAVIAERIEPEDVITLLGLELDERG